MGLLMNDVKGKIIELDLNDVLPNRFQPRIKFNEESIIELSESIKEHGVIQPIIVRPIGDKYEIVAGERRYKASVLSGLTTIPARIIDLNDKDSAEIALIENVQRKDLTPIEEAISYKKILDMGYITQEQLAIKLGKSQSAIANKKRLLNLCDEVQEALMEEKISERHARSLLKLESSADQQYMLNRIIKERLTVRKTDDEITKLLTEGKIVANEKTEDSTKNFNVMTLAESKTEVEKNVSIEPITKEVISPKPVEIKQEENINPGFMDVDKIKDNAKDLDLDDSIIDLSDLFSDEVISKAIEPEPEEQKDIKKTDFIDTSVFSKFLTPESEIKEIEKEENMGEKNMINASLTENSGQLNQNEVPTPVINVRSFGRFFDQADMDDEDKAPENPIFEFQNDIKTPEIFTPVEPEPASMFSNLMTPEASQNKPTEVIDAATFDKFLDPTYIDGKQQTPVAPVNKDVIDASVFAKFLDPEYSGSENGTPAGGEQKTISFAQYLSGAAIPEAGDLVEETNGFGFAPSEQVLAPEVMTTNIEQPALNNMETPITNNIEQVSNVNNVDLMTPMNSIETSTVNNAMEKPDLLSPINSNQTMVIPMPPMEPSPVIENPPSVFDNLMASPTSSATTIAESAVAPVIEVNEGKPDLLAPMGATITPNFEQSVAPTNSFLTPDTSIMNNEVKEEPKVESAPVIPVEPEPPVFITATQTPDVTMPTNPIIDNVAESKLLTPETEPPAPSVPETPAITIPEPVYEQPMVNQVVGSPENQPIIVTDYNKQYDPILPATMTARVPKTDFKQVLNMIRSLNDQIENLGFEIDTEEYDLEDIYQVIIKITKK